MEIGEAGKLLNFNDQKLFATLIDDVELMPGFKELTEHKKSLKTIIENNLQELTLKTSKKIQHYKISEELEKELTYFARIKNYQDTDIQANIDVIIDNIPNTSPFRANALEFKPLIKQSDGLLQIKIFLLKWQEHLSTMLMREEILYAEKERTVIENEIQKRLKIAHIVDHTIAPTHPGKLWDLSRSVILYDDLKHLRHYAKFLSKNKELKKIAEELGKASYNSPKNVEHVEEETFKTNELTTQTNMPDDIVGLIHGDNIVRLVPSELVYLSDHDIESDFFYRYANKRLLNHNFQGEDYALKEVHSIHAKSGELIEPKGPFIVAIDTSGSMSGYPQEAAKALCFALLQIAYAENRSVYVCMFSTAICTYELTKYGDLSEVLAFLSKSIKGGTDFEPVIETILNKIAKNYQNADVVLISDFIAQRLKPETITEINKVKAKGNRFNAICLSKYGKTALMNIFDHIWTFDTSLSSKLLRKIK